VENFTGKKLLENTTVFTGLSDIEKKYVIKYSLKCDLIWWCRQWNI